MSAKNGSRNGQHQAGGCWIRRDKRLAVYLRDEFRCVYCGRNLHKADPQDITLDHVRAKSNGGHNHESNLVTACRSCNCARKDTPLSKWADVATRKTIRRQTRRNLKAYRKLAKSLIEDERNGQ